MNTVSPGGFPQMVSFVPLLNRLVCTVSANQFVSFRLVLNSGNNAEVFVPVERNTMFESKENPTILIDGGAGGSTVRMVPIKDAVVV